MKIKHEILTSLSNHRFNSYWIAAGKNIENGLLLYKKNQIMGQCMYVPLQNLEIGLRNSLYQAISVQWGANWMDDMRHPLTTKQQEQVGEAKANLAKSGKRIEPNRLVAELTMGFWAAMFSGHYEQTLWHRGLLISVFPNGPTSLTTASIKSDIDEIRLFRNRVYHHEPIFHRAKAIAMHEKIQNFLTWINPEYRAWNDVHDGFLKLKEKL